MKPSSVKTPSADFLDPPARTLRWVTAGMPRFERPRLRLADFSLTPTSSMQTNWSRRYKLATRWCQARQRRSLRSGAYADSRFVVYSSFRSASATVLGLGTGRGQVATYAA